MKVTIITPCYNSAPFINETVQSVLDQDSSDWEYIFVDDGSTDKTPKILKTLTEIDNRIRVVAQTNGGTSAARNRGARECAHDSRYLLFLDHDDLLEPNALRIMSGYLNAHPSVCLLGCQFQEIDVHGNPCSSRQRSRWVPSVFGIPRMLRASERLTPFVTFYCGTGQGPFAMFRRSVFEQTTGWTTEFWPHEDTDMFCQMALLGEVHYLPDRLYRKRIHPDCGFLDVNRMQDAYTRFRLKWDSYQPHDQRESQLLKKAARFYKTSFQPLRNLKVAAKAFLEFLRTGDLAKLGWAFQLSRDAARDAVRYRVHLSANK
jgi:glycosyltransferase involved in cell wall biosynthesis